MKKLLLILAVILLLGFLWVNQQNFLPQRENSPSPTPVDNQLLAAAREYVRKNSVAGIVFDLSLIKQVGRWALVEVVSRDADRAAVILEKIADQWVPRAFGTIFPEWEEKVPELFRP